MHNKLEAFIDQLQQAKTLDDLHGVIFGLRDLYDVEHLVYHSVKSTVEQYGVLTYKEDWAGRYVEQNYERIDPVVLGCFQSFQPVMWKELDWSSKNSRRFLGEALDNGVGNQGFSVPIRGPSGQFALFTVNDTCKDDRWAKFTAEHHRQMILIAHYLNNKALEIEHGKLVSPIKALSPRESDSLTLLAMGYSRAHAADTLKISEHTLRVYIEAARFKLGSANTTHAVAAALSRGLIVD